MSLQTPDVTEVVVDGSVLAGTDVGEILARAEDGSSFSAMSSRFTGVAECITTDSVRRSRRGISK